MNLRLLKNGTNNAHFAAQIATSEHVCMCVATQTGALK